MGLGQQRVMQRTSMRVTRASQQLFIVIVYMKSIISVHFMLFILFYPHSCISTNKRVIKKHIVRGSMLLAKKMKLFWWYIQYF